ncbi:HAD family hydrolase [Amycolatopsis sp. NPDC059027]|uniref:HAD family hydrolase n=1 Tax=Amycolatopsis sp. NPDC059027 TaxID=3346709 RepID=UPI00366DF114
MNWIVFDYGDVLSRRTAALPKLAATLGVEAGRLEEHYWALREPYDRGCGDLEYWQSVGKALGVEVDEAKSEELTSIDVEGWSHLEPSSAELLDALGEAGAALALLSNAPSSFGRWARAQDWARHFRVTLFSGDLGCVKPDERIYRILLDRLGAAPADCLFFDDRKSNVDAAVALGIRAHVWDGADAAKAALG